MSFLETYRSIHESWSWLVPSLLQFITNMINVNITSVCQVNCLFLDWLFTLHMLKYLLYLQHPCLPDCLIKVDLYFSLHFSPFSSPTPSFSFSSSAVSTMVPAVSQLFPKQRWTTPTLSVLATYATFSLSLSLSVSACLSLPLLVVLFFFVFFFNKLFPFFSDPLVSAFKGTIIVFEWQQ